MLYFRHFVSNDLAKVYKYTNSHTNTHTENHTDSHIFRTCLLLPKKGRRWGQLGVVVDATTLHPKIMHQYNSHGNHHYYCLKLVLINISLYTLKNYEIGYLSYIF